LPAKEVPAAVAEAASHLFNDLAIYPCHISIQVFPEIRTSARISASSIQSSHDLMTESETIQALQMTRMCANKSPIQVVGKFKVLKLQMDFLLLCTIEFDVLFSPWKILDEYPKKHLKNYKGSQWKSGGAEFCTLNPLSLNPLQSESAHFVGWMMFWTGIVFFIHPFG
jgi:hypothetical protein